MQSLYPAPINDLAMMFFLAIPRNSAKAAASDVGSGKSSCRSNRIFFGTVASIKASIFSKPSSCSIFSTSLSFGPMWRRAKESESALITRECMGDGMEEVGPFKFWRGVL